MKNKWNSKMLVRAAVLAALAAVLTFFPKFPTPTGYVHFGDSIIYVAAAFLGPIPGAFVGAIGHSLADLLGGYPIFVLPTFIIKGLMGFVIGKIIYQNFKATRFILAGIVSLVIVTLGYFIAEVPMFGTEAAMAVFISSPVQWLMSVAASVVFIPIVSKILKR